MFDNFDKLSRTLLHTIDESVPDMIELQRLMTSIPALAPESGGTGELEKCNALEKWLREHGITNLERFDAPDSRAAGGIRPNLIATIAGKSEKALWIMAHLDVVPEGEASLWHTDPWTVVEKDGKIYGRGVEDNQQGIVSGVFAALAFIKNNIMPALTIKLLFVADEETGSTYGIRYLLENCQTRTGKTQTGGKNTLFQKDDLIIIPDGGDEKGESIEIAEKNLLWLRITVKGKQAHGSRPDEGCNAFLAGSALALELNSLEQFFDKRDPLFSPPYSTVQPTKKEANVPNINTIPGEDVFCLDCRILPCYPLNAVRSEIAKRVSKIERAYGVTVSFTEEQAAESPATPVDAPVVAALTEAIQHIYKISARPVGIGGGTVGAYLRPAGYHAAVWSRIAECAHQPNEYCELANLAGDAKVFAAIAAG